MVKKNISKNLTTALPGVLVIALIAGALTYGGKMAVAEATKPKPAAVKTVTVTKTEDTSTTTNQDTGGANSTGSAATSSAAASAGATTTTTPAQPTTKTATTNSFVYLRPTASTAGVALQDLQAGTVVQYETKTGTKWQKVTVNGVSGYVYTKWLTY